MNALPKANNTRAGKKLLNYDGHNRQAGHAKALRALRNRRSRRQGKRRLNQAR